MGAYLVTLGSFKMKVQAGKRVRKYDNDFHVHLDELAVFKTIATAKAATQAVLEHYIGKYAYHESQKRMVEINEYPPHSIFCECKTCDPGEWLMTRKGKKK